jgi:tellurite resistance protein TehA-like permease
MAEQGHACLVLAQCCSSCSIEHFNISNTVGPSLPLLHTLADGLYRWSTQFFCVGNMTPIWIFPAYPLLIVGPFAGNLASRISSQAEKLTIILAGFTVQGVGFLFAFSIYAAFIYRLMTQKLPRESLRPGMFVSVGPSGFTVAGIIAMAAELRFALPENFMDAGDSRLTAQILQVMANWMCLWIWG